MEQLHPVWLHIFFIRYTCKSLAVKAYMFLVFLYLGTIFYPVFPLWCVLSTEPSSCFFIPCLKVCTARSTRPFVLGWEGAEVMCLTQFFCKNDVNALPTKLDPLSDTTISGKSCEAKVDLILSMVTLEVAEFTQWISIHLEWASMISKNIFPMKGPAKSTCTRDQGRLGHSQGCNGEHGGV